MANTLGTLVVVGGVGAGIAFVARMLAGETEEEQGPPPEPSLPVGTIVRFYYPFGGDFGTSVSVYELTTVRIQRPPLYTFELIEGSGPTVRGPLPLDAFIDFALTQVGQMTTVNGVPTGLISSGTVELPGGGEIPFDAWLASLPEDAV